MYGCSFVAQWSKHLHSSTSAHHAATAVQCASCFIRSQSAVCPGQLLWTAQPSPIQHTKPHLWRQAAGDWRSCAPNRWHRSAAAPPSWGRSQDHGSWRQKQTLEKVKADLRTLQACHRTSLVPYGQEATQRSKQATWIHAFKRNKKSWKNLPRSLAGQCDLCFKNC